NLDRNEQANSKIEIVKMHGSINWERDLYSGNGLHLRNNFDNGDQIFDGLTRNRVLYPNNHYEGKITSELFLPSFIKHFNSAVFAKLWRRAYDILLESNEMVFIGYSLPKEDSAAQLLFSLIDLAEKKFTIVDIDVESVLNNLSNFHPSHSFVGFDSIEEYLTRG
ncbi:MAG: hypothetical protein AB1728_06365, partial [Bacteroidota bacterium]